MPLPCLGALGSRCSAGWGGSGRASDPRSSPRSILQRWRPERKQKQKVVLLLSLRDRMELRHDCIISTVLQQN